MGYISLEAAIPFFPFRLFFFYALFVFIRISLFRVNIPMGGTAEVYTDLEQRRMFSYANVRKAAYRGSKTIINIRIILTTHIISVYKFSVIGGIFLTWFTDSMLFSMMVKTNFAKPVDTIQDLFDRDMTIGII